MCAHMCVCVCVREVDLCDVHSLVSLVYRCTMPRNCSLQLTVVVTRFRFQSADGTGRSRRNGKLSVSHEEIFQMVKGISDSRVYGSLV